MVLDRWVRTIGLVFACAAVLAGCNSGGQGTAPSDELSLQDLADVAFVDQSGLGRVEVTEPSDDGSVAMSVVMSSDASDGQIIDAAKLAHSFGRQHQAKYRWATHLYVGEVPAAVQVHIDSTEWKSAEDDVQAALTIAKLPGVQRIATTGATAYVTTDDLRAIPKLVSALRTEPIWVDGGSITLTDGRVKIMDSPRRISIAQLEAITNAAATYPAGVFALEAASTGERYPELFINKVAAADGAAIAKAFSNPALRPNNTEDYELDFMMRAFGTDGNPVDTGGTFGR